MAGRGNMCKVAKFYMLELMAYFIPNTTICAGGPQAQWWCFAFIEVLYLLHHSDEVFDYIDNITCFAEKNKIK